MHVFKIITSSDRTESKCETTRWVVKEVNDQTFDDLKTKLQALFKTRTNRFFISWCDGQDYCTIRESCDLLDAVLFMTEGDKKDTAIRLFASLDNTEHKTIFGEVPDLEEPELIPATDSLEEALGRNSIGDNIIDKSVEELKRLSTKEGEYVRITMNLDEQQAVIPEPKDVASEVVEPSSTQPAVLPQGPQFAPMMLPDNFIPPQMMGGTYSPYYGYPMGYQGYQMPMMYPPYGAMAQQPVCLDSANALVTMECSTPLPSVAAVAMSPRVSVSLPCGPCAPPVEPPKQVPKPTEAAKSAPKVAKPTTSYKPAQVAAALSTLRNMGYAQDEKFLKKVIRHHNCNINQILDALSKH